MAFLAAALPMMGMAAGGTMATALSIGGMALSALGAVSDYRAAGAQAKAVRQTADYNARVMEQQAGQERAASQRTAMAQRKEGDLATSRAVALGAAGGGSVSDPTMVNLIADLETQSTYNALSALYSGEEQARGLQQGADLSRYEGNNEAKAIKRAAKSKLISDAAGIAMQGSSLFGKYAPSGNAGASIGAGAYRGASGMATRSTDLVKLGNSGSSLAYPSITGYR